MGWASAEETHTHTLTHNLLLQRSLIPNQTFFYNLITMSFYSKVTYLHSQKIENTTETERVTIHKLLPVCPRRWLSPVWWRNQSLWSGFLLFPWFLESGLWIHNPCANKYACLFLTKDTIWPPSLTSLSLTESTHHRIKSNQCGFKCYQDTSTRLCRSRWVYYIVPVCSERVLSLAMPSFEIQNLDEMKNIHGNLLFALL